MHEHYSKVNPLGFMLKLAANLLTLTRISTNRCTFPGTRALFFPMAARWRCARGACEPSPAEYGSCLSTLRNSSLSYLARIHCSLRSLQKSTSQFLTGRSDRKFHAELTFPVEITGSCQSYHWKAAAVSQWSPKKNHTFLLWLINASRVWKLVVAMPRTPRSA